ncbi:mechanosensitive ion channel family protein [Rhizobium sp. CNPSo 4039]|uniref:mechanosensitive ion channel family protein n=1 Tax=Rhizobium sp. CNPSo 4039 TaxID=3021409 RepID=UPI00254A1F42|nr:mechanosensitive ion channel family protein [Rhizobium sp. CNPSo 4039]MDK4717274.1 mechanosensitive ion channel family protein [Rhizobium sp. CNPSo 4039]
MEAAAGPAQQQKIDDLVKLLQDPDIRSWLTTQPAKAPAPQSPGVPSTGGLAGWEASTRAHINEIISAIPSVPSELLSAFLRVRQDAIAHGFAPVFLIFAGLVAFGLAAEWLYRSVRSSSDGLMARLAPIGVFALGIAIIFFAVDWPPLARLVLLAYLSGFVVFRICSTLIGFAASQPSLRLRGRILMAVLSFAIASAALARPLGVAETVADATSIGFSIIALVVAIEATWTSWQRPKNSKAALTLLLVVVWGLWAFGLKTLFWLGLYIVALPVLLLGVGRAAESVVRSEASEVRRVLVVRGARALVIAAAAGWLAIVWQLNPEGLGHGNPAVTAIFYGLLKSVLILLLADLVWQLAKNWIDRKLVAPSNTSALAPADAARQARFRTLLPILRNALAVAVIVMASLIILSEFGVQIAPLIAGAGIFGVALGFGSQTLVKDIISGVFYMFDDAFRVGEYIQAKNYKGTVEGFSLRSVRLRHHRGPVFTVPFGELGAVENMSRDWVIDKFRVSVGFDTDVEKARKLTKQIGADLKQDPELGPLFIEPLKLKGVEEFSDYGMVLSFGMMTVPGMQTYIRRKAYLKIREAFKANGIEFAQPTVNVGGDDRGSSAAGHASLLAQKAKVSATAEGNT